MEYEDMKRIVMKNARNFNYVKRDKEYGTVEGHDSEKKGMNGRCCMKS